MDQDPLKSFFEDPLHMDNVVVLRSRTISMSDLEGQRGFMVNPTPECAMFCDEAIMCTHAGLSILKPSEADPTKLVLGGHVRDVRGVPLYNMFSPGERQRIKLSVNQTHRIFYFACSSYLFATDLSGEIFAVVNCGGDADGGRFEMHLRDSVYPSSLVCDDETVSVMVHTPDHDVCTRMKCADFFTYMQTFQDQKAMGLPPIRGDEEIGSKEQVVLTRPEHKNAVLLSPSCFVGGEPRDRRTFEMVFRNMDEIPEISAIVGPALPPDFRCFAKLTRRPQSFECCALLRVSTNEPAPQLDILFKGRTNTHDMKWECETASLCGGLGDGVFGVCASIEGELRVGICKHLPPRTQMLGVGAMAGSVIKKMTSDHAPSAADMQRFDSFNDMIARRVQSRRPIAESPLSRFSYQPNANLLPTLPSRASGLQLSQMRHHSEDVRRKPKGGSSKRRSNKRKVRKSRKH